MCHLSLNYLRDTVQSGLLHSEHLIFKTQTKINSRSKMNIYIYMYIYIYIYIYILERDIWIQGAEGWK